MVAAPRARGCLEGRYLREFLGVPSSVPLYVTATALAKLADSEGEVAITRACAKANVPYMCPTLSSCSLEEMTSARAPDQTQWFQLYVNKDRAIAKDLLQRAETGGCKAVFVTVDAPQLGRRERDIRLRRHRKAMYRKGIRRLTPPGDVQRTLFLY